MTSKHEDVMPLLIDRYRADTAKLSTEQHGAYLLLLMEMWKQGGTLPADETQLMNCTRLPPARWRANRDVLMAYFIQASDIPGAITQKRLDKLRRRTNARQQAGQIGGSKTALLLPPKRPKSDPKGQAKGEAKSGFATPFANPLPSLPPAPPSLPEFSIVPSPSAQGLVDTPQKPAHRPPCPIDEIVALFHKHLPQLPKVQVINAHRRKTVAARWNEVCTDMCKDGEECSEKNVLDWFDWFFENASHSSFLAGLNSGKGHENWRADFDFLMAPSKFARVVEGSYR